MNKHSFKTLVFVGLVVAVSSCVVEMHPADSSPTPSAAPVSASGAPAAPQQVQVLSGPSGITAPVRNPQPAATAVPTSADTSATGAASTNAQQGTATGGASAALR